MTQHSFKLEKIIIENYKKYSHLELLFKNRFTLIIGENGSGKTTVLDALATLLGGYLHTFSEISSAERHSVSLKDIKMNIIDEHNNIFTKFQTPITIEGICILDDEERVSIKRIRQNAGKNTATKLPKEENASLLSFNKKFQNEIDRRILPLISYQGAGRLWEQENTSASMENLTRLDGYKECLKAKSTYKNFIKWFAKMEFNAFQLREEIPILEPVRSSVMRMLSQLKNKEVERFLYRENDLEIKYKSQSQREKVSNLSDGYKILIGLVCDIAYRMAILNPHLGLEVTHKTAGVVLIDELDLHLHPKWQREIVALLLSLFPKVQFIASSHSPFIIQSMSKNSIIKLDESSENLSVDARELSIEDIAENIQKIDLPQMSKHKQKMLKTAKEYFEKLDLLEKGGISQKEIEAIKIRLDEVSAIYDDNMAYVAFLERKRLISESKL